MTNVGPVLTKCEFAEQILAAIQELNSDVQVVDRGAYYRVQVKEKCVLSRESLEARTGRKIQFAVELEAVMPSFSGKFKLDEDLASWSV